MDTHLDSDIEIHRYVLGVDRDGLRLVDRDDLVLGNVVFRTRSDLQNVVVCHDSFVFAIGLSMLWFLKAHAEVTYDQQSAWNPMELLRGKPRRWFTWADAIPDT